MGLTRLPRWRLAAALAVLAATIPATVYEVLSARTLAAPSYGNANFITANERSALQFLERDRTAGGVLTRFYLGAVVPARTGRRTFIGNCLWSEPECSPRAQLAQQLFDGTMAPGDARRFVHGIRLPASGIGAGPIGVFGPQGELLALAEDRGDELRSLCVFVG